MTHPSRWIRSKAVAVSKMYTLNAWGQFLQWRGCLRCLVKVILCRPGTPRTHKHVKAKVWCTSSLQHSSAALEELACHLHQLEVLLVPSVSTSSAAGACLVTSCSSSLPWQSLPDAAPIPETAVEASKKLPSLMAEWHSSRLRRPARHPFRAGVEALSQRPV